MLCDDNMMRWCDGGDLIHMKLVLNRSAYMRGNMTYIGRLSPLSHEAEKHRSRACNIYIHTPLDPCKTQQDI